jgi:magnesium-transporting ATPase (P-type)
LIAEGSKDDAGSHEVPSPIMLSGSKVLSGEGKMVIIAVGKLSAIGKIQNLLGNDEDIPTPLQLKLETIAEDIGKFGLISAIFILVVLMIRWVID